MLQWNTRVYDVDEKPAMRTLGESLQFASSGQIGALPQLQRTPKTRWPWKKTDTGCSCRNGVVLAHSRVKGEGLGFPA